MGHNFGSIHVRAKPGVTQDRVVELIDAFWTDHGATPRKKGVLDVEPMTLDDGGDEVSFAISRETDGWIAIADSERYTACEPLAQHLSAELATEVIHFEICDAANAASYTVFDAGTEQAKTDDEDASGYSATLDFLDGKRLPLFGLYFDQLTKKECKQLGLVLLGYTDASDDDYFGGGDDGDEEPEPSAEEVAAQQAKERAEQRALADAAWAVWLEVRATGDLLNASRDFRKLTSRRLEDTHGWYGDLDDFAKILLGAGDFARALELATTMAAFDEDGWRGTRGDALLGLDRYDEATPDVRWLLVEDADIDLTYDRVAYLYQRTGRRAAGLALAAARRAVELYSRNEHAWPVEVGPPPSPEDAKATVAAILEDELRDEPLERHRDLDDLAQQCEALGARELGARVAREVRRRARLRERITDAIAADDRRTVARLLHRLPPGHYTDATAADYGTRLELLRHAVGGGNVHRMGELLRVAIVLGLAAEQRDLLPLAAQQARNDASVYHPAAVVALAAGDRALALDLCRRARDAYGPTFREMPRDPALAELHDDPAFRALFADLATRPILARDDDAILVREGYQIAFLMAGPVASVVPKLARVVEAFLERADDLAWGMVGSNATHYEDLRPFDDKLLARIRKQLDPARDDVYFEIFGPEKDNPAYWIAISADSDGAAVDIRLPPGEPPRRRVDHLATLVPYTYGFASPAMLPSSFYSSGATLRQRLAAIAQWYPGLDLVEMVGYRIHLGGKLPGAKWLNFLDRTRVRRLGGLEALEAKLAPLGIRIAPVGHGIVVQAGEPDRELGNREQLRAVHAAFAPLLELDWNFNGALELYPGGPAAWIRRYLDGLVIPPFVDPVVASGARRTGL